MKIIWQGGRLDDKACDIKQQLPFLVKRQTLLEHLAKRGKNGSKFKSNLELMESFIKGKKGKHNHLEKKEGLLQMHGTEI